MKQELGIEPFSLAVSMVYVGAHVRCALCDTGSSRRRSGSSGVVNLSTSAERFKKRRAGAGMFEVGLEAVR